MKCPRCGYILHNDASSCPHCGQMLNGGEGISNIDEIISQKESLAENQMEQEAQKIPKQKSRWIAGTLQLFLGGFGAGRFYLGYNVIGALQFFTCFIFGIGYIWGFLDGILILARQLDVDANGNLLKG